MFLAASSCDWCIISSEHAPSTPLNKRNNWNPWKTPRKFILNWALTHTPLPNVSHSASRTLVNNTPYIFKSLVQCYELSGFQREVFITRLLYFALQIPNDSFCIGFCLDRVKTSSMAIEESAQLTRLLFLYVRRGPPEYYGVSTRWFDIGPMSKTLAEYQTNLWTITMNTAVEMLYYSTQYLFTLQVSRYFHLALQSGITLSVIKRALISGILSSERRNNSGINSPRKYK